MLGKLCALALCATFSFSLAHAADYPVRPVKVIVGYAPGSGPDIHARAVAQQLSTDLGQTFFVENRIGANGTLAVRAVVAAPPDGYTILFSSDGISSTPFVYKNLGYDILTDLTPVATQGILDGLFVLVDAKSDIKTLQELVARARKEPLNYGSPGIGNGLHLATEVFSKATGIKMQHIPYKGASEVMNAMLSGNVQVMFVTPPSVVGMIKSGRVRAIGFTGSKPFASMPEVPLVKDVFPGMEPIRSWGMFFMSAKTPPELAARLNKDIHAALLKPALATKLQSDGYFPDTRNLAETAAYFRKEVAATGETVNAAGIKPE